MEKVILDVTSFWIYMYCPLELFKLEISDHNFFVVYIPILQRAVYFFSNIVFSSGLAFTDFLRHLLSLMHVVAFLYVVFHYKAEKESGRKMSRHFWWEEDWFFTNYVLAFLSDWILSFLLHKNQTFYLQGFTEGL